MKKSLLAILIVLLCFSFAEAQQVVIIKKKAAGLTYVYPKNCTQDADFGTAGGSVATTIAVGDSIVGAGQSITKLYFYLADKQEAEECSIAVYDNGSNPSKVSTGCHFVAANGWNECSDSYTLANGTTYTIWVECDSAYKVQGTGGSPDCDNYYRTGLTYTQDMQSSLGGRSADAGCSGMKASY